MTRRMMVTGMPVIVAARREEERVHNSRGRVSSSSSGGDSSFNEDESSTTRTAAASLGNKMKDRGGTMISSSTSFSTTCSPASPIIPTAATRTATTSPANPTTATRASTATTSAAALHPVTLLLREASIQLDADKCSSIAGSPPPPPPPVEHVVLRNEQRRGVLVNRRSLSSPSLDLGSAPATTSGAPSCGGIAGGGDEDAASLSDVSTGSYCAGGVTSSPSVQPRSLFKAYWDKHPDEQPAPGLVRASSTSSSTSSSASSMSSYQQHHQDPSHFDYEDSLKEEVGRPPVVAQEQSQGFETQERRSIFGDTQRHRYRSYSEPSLRFDKACLAALSSSDDDGAASASAATATSLSSSAQASSKSATAPPPAPPALGCFSFSSAVAAPSLLFRKTRSASTLHDHRHNPSSSSPAQLKRSCLRRGRFSSSLLSDMASSSASSSSNDSQEAAATKESLSPSSSSSSSTVGDQGSVTFNEDGNMVVVFDAPHVLWSQRGWSDYFAC